MKPATTPDSNPGTRDPREFDRGLFIAAAQAFGGATGFSWFGSDAEALSWLHAGLPAVYLDGDEDDTRAVSAAIARAIHGVTELKVLDLAPINKALSGLCEIRWAGMFYDLENGNKPFEREIQADFRDNIFGLERMEGDLCDLDYLAHHLEGYAG